ncbi:MAG: hypothetical protein A2V66_01430 [Ignavibacteria bacterium RBG_13_36_8]|nr:MAG: hypothetical protein A2V66_01430 [Ignavibacteria bacterium RBG_13_36_8]
MGTIKRDTKKLFLKKGTCSHTFFHILNREFGHIKDNEERATDPLAGGILQMGYQCGMLWGASMGVGAESFRRCNNTNQAIGLAIKATQHIMKSFVKRGGSADCGDITETDFSSKLSFAKYFFSGRFLSCFSLADKWAPEAIQAAHEGLSNGQRDLPNQCKSCASEVVKKMGGSNEEAVMVAGLAGGIGLSGNACGALSAAIWMKMLDMCRKQTMKSSLKNPEAEIILEKFYAATDYEIICNEITGKRFNTLDDHTEFIKNGSCSKLINVLAES